MACLRGGVAELTAGHNTDSDIPDLALCCRSVRSVQEESLVDSKRRNMNIKILGWHELNKERPVSVVPRSIILSLIFVIISSLLLCFELFQTSEITRLGVFRISYLTSFLLIQFLFLYVLHLRRKIYEKIHSETNRISILYKFLLFLCCSLY